LGQTIEPVVVTPEILRDLLSTGVLQPNPGVEQYYAASQLEWVQQTYDGRMDYSAVSTSAVEDILGRPALPLREWALRHVDELRTMIHD
jgi:NAD(P)H dehydrogenase (quinone)